MKVTAVIVTYNRLELLKQCVDSVRNQTRKPDEIIVVNNSSTDGTDAWLADQADLKVITQPNSGSAGGQYTGIKEAYNSGSDWIWCIDTDVVFDSIALEKLLDQIEKCDDNLGFLHSTLFFEDGKLANPNIPELASPIPLLNSLVNDRSRILVLSSSFGSLLIPKDVIRNAGLPCREFFIWGDDAEYTLRIISLGYKGYMVFGSKGVHHNDSNPLNSFISLAANDVKLKYGIRNMIYVIRQRNLITHSSRLRGIASAFAFVFRNINQRRKYTDLELLRFSFVLIVQMMKGFYFNPNIELP